MEKSTTKAEPSPDIAAEAERRQLTVMFCDLIGSTPLSERLDPEVLREVLRNYQEVCKKVINRYEGHIARYIGDGLLVYFGYPQAHEDDPQRAVLGGLGIVEAMAGLNARLEQDQNIRLDMRIGIHTGMVVVGDMDSAAQLETMAVVGDVPNMANRLQHLAEPNTVLVSADTHRLIEGFFDWQDLGKQLLTGFSYPVRVYEALHESTARSRLEASAGRVLTPLVGRESEIGLLLECWEQVGEGIGRVVLLNGEAGIGKSRLVQVLKEHVAQNPGAWLTECRCSPYHRNSAFYPLIDLMERVTLRFEPGDKSAERLQKLEGFLVQYGFSLPETVPLFASLLSLPLNGDYAPLNLTPERQRRRTLEAMLQVLLKIAAAQPVLFVVEDLHWIDPSTLNFLSMVIDQGPTAHILVLLTYRPDFEPPWKGKTFTTQITLNRLNRTQVTKIMDCLTAGKALPEAIQEQVIRKTDGVPLFIEELTKMVLESGLLRECENRYELIGPLPPLAIPTTLQDSLMARLDRLGSAKEIAQLGATLGREFSYQWLRAVSTQDEAKLQRNLAQLVEVELLYQRGVLPQATFMFKHTLIQEAAYASLLISTRQRHHAQIARTFTEQFPEIAETQPEFLAHHYTLAGLGEQAIPHWYRAGERALQRSAHIEAIDHLNRGLDLLGDLPDMAGRVRQEMNLKIVLGQAQRKAGRIREAMQTFQKAANIAKELKSPEDLATAALGHEEARWRFNLPAEPAVGLLEEALSTLKEEDSLLRVRLLAALGRAIVFQSRKRADALVKQAIAMARRMHDPLALLNSLHAGCFFGREPEKIEERMATVTEVLRLAEAVGDDEKKQEAYALLFYDHMELGDLRSADANLKGMHEVIEKLQQPVYIYITTVSRTMRILLEGRFKEAMALARQTLDMGKKIQVENPDGTFGLQMFVIYREQGHLQALGPAIKHFVEKSPAASVWRPGLALVYCDLGMAEEARKEFERLSENDFSGLPRDSLWATCIAYLSEVCAYLKDSDRADILYRLLLPYNGRAIMTGNSVTCYGATSRYLGLLATAMGRWKDAERHFQDAVEMNANMGAKPWLAHTQHDYAAMLQKRNEPGDGKKSESLLEKAQSTAWELGMVNLLKKVDALNAGREISASRSQQQDLPPQIQS